jgi:hypothetical protein
LERYNWRANPVPSYSTIPLLGRDRDADGPRMASFHAFRSAAHWTGHVLCAAGTVTAGLSGVATAKALRSPMQASFGGAAAFGAGACFLHLVGSLAANGATMWDPESPDEELKFSRFAALERFSSFFTVPLVGAGAGFLAHSAGLSGADPNKASYQLAGIVFAFFGAATAACNHVAGALIKIDGDLEAALGPYGGRKGI